MPGLPELERLASGGGGRVPSQMLQPLQALAIACAQVGFGDQPLDPGAEEALSTLDGYPAPFPPSPPPARATGAARRQHRGHSPHSAGSLKRRRSDRPRPTMRSIAAASQPSSPRIASVCCPSAGTASMHGVKASTAPDGRTAPQLGRSINCPELSRAKLATISASISWRLAVRRGLKTKRVDHSPRPAFRAPHGRTPRARARAAGPASSSCRRRW